MTARAINIAATPRGIWTHPVSRVKPNVSPIQRMSAAIAMARLVVGLFIFGVL